MDREWQTQKLARALTRSCVRRRAACSPMFDDSRRCASSFRAGLVRSQTPHRSRSIFGSLSTTSTCQIRREARSATRKVSEAHALHGKEDRRGTPCASYTHAVPAVELGVSTVPGDQVWSFDKPMQQEFPRGIDIAYRVQVCARCMELSTDLAHTELAASKQLPCVSSSPPRPFFSSHEVVMVECASAN